jgi:WD40 repeat protein
MSEDKNIQSKLEQNISAALIKKSCLRWLIGIGLWLVSVAVFAQFFGEFEDPLLIKPAGSVSLEYPNEWDINTQIALSNDGSRLVDASLNARYIRVWDWKNKNVIQRLLLNEKAPAFNDRKDRPERVLQSSLGQELAISPNGQLMAACAHTGGQTISRIWSLDNGEIVADIPNYQHHVPGLNQEMVFGMGCNSISFSKNGKYMAMLVGLGSQSANEADFKNAVEHVNNFNYKTGKNKNGTNYEELETQKFNPANISGIAVFETQHWKLERFFYRFTPKQTFNSRPLFDADSKTVSAVVFDQAPRNPNWHRLVHEWAGNRIVRWDIATGEQLDEKIMPQLAESPSVGVWWTPLSNGREVWWQNGYQQRMLDGFSAESLDQSEADVAQCKIAPATEPTFASEVKSNCGYNWVLTVMNLDSGKLKYLAPFKKNARATTDKLRERYYSANFSPDGAHIVLFTVLHSSNNRISATSSVEILDSSTLQMEGHYSDDIWIDMEPVFSSENSRYIAFPMRKSRGTDKSALIFELPKKK